MPARTPSDGHATEPAVCAERLTGPAAWVSADLVDDASWIQHLDEEQATALLGRALSLPERDYTFATVDADECPMPELAGTIDRARSQLEDGRGIVLLRGLPVNTLSEADVARVYAAVITHLGWPIVQDTAGTLIDRVADRGQSYADISVRGYQTNAQLTPHCDSGDLVALLCVRPARRGGESLLTSAVSVHNRLLERYPHLLEPLYRGFHYNIRGNGPPGQHRDVTAHRVPVYEYLDGKLSCRFNEKAILTAEELPGVEPLTDLERDAIRTLAAVSKDDDLGFEMKLETGDLLLLYNHTVLHNRSAFTDGPGPQEKRLLLRQWVNVPNARRLTMAFADHYNTGPREGPHVDDVAAVHSGSHSEQRWESTS